MAVVYIPAPRALMVRGDGKIIRHDRKVVVFPDWRNMSERYSGSLSFQWGGLSETQTYENNYITWIEPWQTKPSLPSGGIAFRAVSLPPVYVLDMSADRWSGTQYDASVHLCEEQFGVSFKRYDDQKCAWAWAQSEGESDSEKVLSGSMCCACEVQRDDFDGAETLCGNDKSCVVAVALETEKERDELYWFEDGVLWTEFTIGGSISCKGIKLYRMDGTEYNFPESVYSYSSPDVPVYTEVRMLVPGALPAYNANRIKVGRYHRDTNDIPGVLSGASGRPFVEATF